VIIYGCFWRCLFCIFDIPYQKSSLHESLCKKSNAESVCPNAYQIDIDDGDCVVAVVVCGGGGVGSDIEMRILPCNRQNVSLIPCVSGKLVIVHCEQSID
jgi:hypothetical protein